MGEKYLVEIGNMYFVRFDELKVIMLVEDCPFSYKYATEFDTKEEAEEVARFIGGHVVEVTADRLERLG